MKRFATTSIFAALVALLAAAPPARSVVTPDEPKTKPADLPDAAPDRVLAKFRPGLARAARGQALAARGLREIARTRGRRVAVLEIAQKARDVRAVAAELRESGLVEYAEPDYVLRAARFPNDPLFSQEWGLHNAGDRDVDAPEAWDITTGDPAVVVAVIDTGVDYTHPDLAANMWRNPGEVPGNGLDDDANGWVDDVFGIDAIGAGDGDPRDDHNHGTHVAGTIGAVSNNGVGVAGVAWAVRIMALKFLDSGGSGYTSDAVECLEYAIAMKRDHGVNLKLTSNSWSGSGYSQALADAIRDAADAGILFVAAAGNSGRDNDAQPSYPASYPDAGVLAVAASDSSDALASFSNYGRRSVDLAAPGVNVLSTIPANRYVNFSGTSMATPHVSGAAALLWARSPGASVLGVKAALLNATDAIPGLGARVVSGGRLNARRALEICEANAAMLDVDLDEGFTLPLGQSLDVQVDLRECTGPLLGASVTLAVPGASPIPARDDGVAPDAARDDGVYTASWTPAQGGATSVRIDAAFSGGSLSRTIVGTVAVLPYAMETAAYAWVDTSAATSTGLAGDDVSVSIPIGFAFDYFFSTYTSVRISSNGYLTFGANGTAYANGPIPQPGAPNDLIALFWDDLVTGAGSIRYLRDGVAPNRRLVVSWDGVGLFDASGAVSFQAILHEGSGRIVFQYRDVRAGPPADAGGSASVGIEDATGTLGIQRSLDQPTLADATALAFRRACADADGDAACDAEDNCSTQPNPDQRDSNADGYGNACDPDYDGDGVVGGSDRVLLGDAFGARAGDARYDADLDSDGDGRIGASELLLLGRAFGAAPGPSGYACAGTVPCP